MSVTFSIFVQSPKTWIIECSCGDVTAVSSYPSYQEARDAFDLGVTPRCEDEYCAAYPCTITTAEDAEEARSLNVSNENAKWILQILGLPTTYTDEDGSVYTELSGTIGGADLLQRVQLAQDVEPHDLGQAPTDSFSLREEILADGSMIVKRASPLSTVVATRATSMSVSPACTISPCRPRRWTPPSTGAEADTFAQHGQPLCPPRVRAGSCLKRVHVLDCCHE